MNNLLCISCSMYIICYNGVRISTIVVQNFTERTKKTVFIFIIGHLDFLTYANYMLISCTYSHNNNDVTKI